KYLSISDRKRWQCRERYSGRAEAQCDGCHGIRAPELKTTDHFPNAGEQFIQEKRHLLRRSEGLYDRRDHLPGVADELEVDLKRDVIGIRNRKAGFESSCGIDEEGLFSERDRHGHARFGEDVAKVIVLRKHGAPEN